MARLAELPLAAVAVESRYSALLGYEHAPAGWLADQLVRLQARYAQVPVLFLDTRPLDPPLPRHRPLRQRSGVR